MDGPIEPSKPREEVQQNAYPLPKEFMWSTLDISDPAEVRSGNAPTVHKTESC